MANSYREQNENQKRGNDNNKKKHPFLKFLVLTATVFAFCLAAAGFRLYAQTKDAVNDTYDPINGRQTSKKIQQRKPISILLIGADTGGEGRHDRGNSDTIILATINPITNKSSLLSIPRDSLAEIDSPEHGFLLQKINSAYNLGTEKLTIKTIQKFLNVPVDYYVTIDFKAMTKLVDALGGIDVKVPFTFTSEATGGQTFHKGWQHLNGSRTLAYVRMRHEDPRGDYGRQQRQRQVIQAIVKKGLSIDSVGKYKKILNSISGSTKTDLSFGDMATLVTTYRAAAKNIESDDIKEKTQNNVRYSNFPDGLDFQIVSSKELRRVSNKTRGRLGLPDETIKNQNIRQNRLNKELNNYDFNSESDNQNYVLYNKDSTSHYKKRYY